MRRLNFLQYGLEPFLELAAKLGTGDERSHVQREELLLFKTFWNIAFDDTNRQSLHDRGFPDSRFADEHGVVLCAAGENLNHSPDFVVSPDDGIKLALPG